MLVGISHTKNKKYVSKQFALLRTMTSRAKTNCFVVHKDYTIKQWRDYLSTLTNVEGIVIMDELVPTAVVYRYPNMRDLGITDNIYGNLSQQWVDKDGNGWFDVDEMPEEYHQDCWVGRLLPYCCGYTGIGWLEWFWKQTGYVGAARFTRRSYSETLDYWQKKLNRNTPNPLSSFIATSDWSGVDEEKKEGFGLNIQNLKEKKVFDSILNITDKPYFLKNTSPSRGGGIEGMWWSDGTGTAWHAAHSAAIAMGDMRYDDAYVNMKESKGPTLLLTYACSVAEWDQLKNSNIIVNIFNSIQNNNIKCIISSGLMQWGAGFNVEMDGKGSWGAGDSAGIPDAVYDGKSFFSFMKEHKGKPIGLAHRDWLNLSYKHYIAKNVKYPNKERDWKEILINVLAINIVGDATLLL